MAKPATKAPPPPKLTLHQLQVLCHTDPDAAARYFTVAPGEKPFTVRYRIRPELISDREPREIEKINEELVAGKVMWPLFLNAANATGRANRQADYHRLVEKDPSAPRWVAEGDSWFHYPVVEPDDMIEVMLERKRPVYTIAGAGDEISQMISPAAYRTALRATGGSVLLFSGGGNDMLGGDPDNLGKLLKPYKKGMKPSEVVSDKYALPLERAIGCYRSIFADMKTLFPDRWLFCHGYDYGVPRKGGGYVYPAMADKGFPDDGFMWSVVKVMVDRFNAALSDAAKKAGGRIRYVDLRNTVAAKSASYETALSAWHDEIHPKSAGFRKLADKLETAIKTSLEADA